MPAPVSDIFVALILRGQALSMNRTVPSSLPASSDLSSDGKVRLRPRNPKMDALAKAVSTSDDFSLEGASKAVGEAMRKARAHA